MVFFDNVAHPIETRIDAIFYNRDDVNDS